MGERSIPIDVLIFGGGVAGMWLLDELWRRNCRALLLENHSLGRGQTVGSQGIIHGGLKYMFSGQLTPAAKMVSEMPEIWRGALSGKIAPDLSGTKVRSQSCYIWGTGSIKSRIFMAGSSVALRTAPEAVEKADWPAALRDVPGKVLRVAEQVIDPVSMMTRLAELTRGFVGHVGAMPPVFERDGAGRVGNVVVRLASGEDLRIQPGTVVLSAGEGNAELRERLGLPVTTMQRRPLHMLMVRGKLPELYGHCVGGPRPRITVTTAVDSAGRTVWQVGGQIAEDGVNRSRAELAQHAREELPECVPGLDLSGVEFSSYRVNRAEAATTTGQLPDDVHIVQEGNVITAWPTKLALAPRLAERVIAKLFEYPGKAWTAAAPGGVRGSLGIEVPMPPVARAPWETEGEWIGAR